MTFRLSRWQKVCHSDWALNVDLYKIISPFFSRRRVAWFAQTSIVCGIRPQVSFFSDEVLYVQDPNCSPCKTNSLGEVIFPSMCKKDMKESRSSNIPTTQSSSATPSGHLSSNIFAGCAGVGQKSLYIVTNACLCTSTGYEILDTQWIYPYEASFGLDVEYCGHDTANRDSMAYTPIAKYDNSLMKVHTAQLRSLLW